MKLFFDLETIPAPKELRQASIDSERKKYRNKEIAEDDEQLYRQSALSGDFGRIVCIGYAIDDETAQIISGQEVDILNKWWEISRRATKFIGHNIIEFDIPFLYKRSVVLKTRPSQLIPVKKFQTENIYDTSKEWSRWDNYSNISLHHLSIALGLPSSKEGGIDGSQVFDRFLAGEMEEIYQYCKRDVDLTRKIYKRMLFED